MRIFHAMEKVFANFPHHGKKVSTLWKIRSRLSLFLILNFSFFISGLAPGAQDQKLRMKN